jgi:putative nucleotidyltransferase with HDIG domain
MLDEFNKYVQNYDLNIEAINAKYNHSLRVSSLCKLIAKSLKLSLNETDLCIKIGLLHDIARFYEWTNYNSFHYLKFDHGDYGVKILKKHNYYLNYGIKVNDKEDLLNAVYYHNKYKLPKRLKDNKYCKIIRDADKIDILNIISEDIKHDVLPGIKISDNVKKSFYKHQIIKNKDLITEGDKILSIIALVYDINYDYSLKYIKKKHFLGNIEKQCSKDYKEYFKEVNNYLEKRINKC